MRWRIAVSAAIGFASGAFCWFLMKHFHQDAADFRWALHLAHRLLAQQNPYDTPLEQYPLTAALFALPFVRLQPELAAGLFWGISSLLLAFGLTRQGYTRLLIFFAYPYWAGHSHRAVVSPHRGQRILSAAAARHYGKTPSRLARLPHPPEPARLAGVHRRGTLSLAVMPNWPLLWFRQTWQTMSTSFPILVLPGALLRSRCCDIAIAMRSFFSFPHSCRSAGFLTASSSG